MNWIISEIRQCMTIQVHSEHNGFIDWRQGNENFK